MELLRELVDPEYAMGYSLSLENLSTVPPVICLTVEVPACHIKYIGEIYKKGMGLPVLCCTTESPEVTWLYSFNSVYACFGRVETTAITTKELVNVNIKENKVDWSATTPLVVSVHVPTWILVLEKTGTSIRVGFGPTFFTLTKNTTLSHKLILYETTLDASPNVYLSESEPILGRTAHSNGMSSYKMEDDVSMLAQLLLCDDGTHLDRVERKIVVPNSYRDSLADVSVPISVSQSCPTILRLQFGTLSSLLVHFPRPVSSKHSQLRVVRKSCYIEVIAPLMRATDPDLLRSWLPQVSVTKLTD